MHSVDYSLTLFCKTVPFLVLLSFSTGLTAEVFKCVDKATGKMAFTDKACPNDQPGQYHHVAPANTDSGFDANEAARKKSIRDSENRELQRRTQNHNESVARQERQDELEKERRRERVVRKDGDSLGIYEGRDSADTRGSNDEDPYKRVTN